MSKKVEDMKYFVLLTVILTIACSGPTASTNRNDCVVTYKNGEVRTFLKCHCEATESGHLIITKNEAGKSSLKIVEKLDEIEKFRMDYVRR